MLASQAMNIRLTLSVFIVFAGGAIGPHRANGAEECGGEALGPRGRIHIPIGIADTVDTLKTFVEAEGCFSPGVGSFGVYFWVFDKQSRKLTAPTMGGIKCEHGLAEGKYLIP